MIPASRTPSTTLTSTHPIRSLATEGVYLSKKLLGSKFNCIPPEPGRRILVNQWVGRTVVRIIADLHIHSRYSLATSRDTDLDHLAEGARLKGLNLLSTGDFAHPRWLAELKSKLEQDEGSGIYAYRGTKWVLGDEVSTIYRQGGRTRKVHHLIFAPDFGTVAQIAGLLSNFGKLSSDGRPVLTGIGSAELVERLASISRDVVVIPAHAWTPWFGVLGAKGGFNSLEECYGDQAKRIFAIETGLSSDPGMNWRISSLDRVALVSNSDAHSPNPWRLGREANVFELNRVTYSGLFGAIKSKDPARFLFTVEVDPAYGKYHFSGHSKCRVSLSPGESRERGNTCPKCGKPLTVGVLQRVEELADRPEGFTPPRATPFRRLLPLYEVISYATEVRRLYARKVLEQQDRLIKAFGNEFDILLDVPEDSLARVAGARVAAAVVAVREEKVRVIPGYDGVYGTPVFP